MHASVLETILNIGLIAGAGKLPKHIISGANESGYEYICDRHKEFR